jgi:thymidylate synthase
MARKALERNHEAPCGRAGSFTSRRFFSNLLAREPKGRREKEMKLEFLEARDLPDAWFQCVYRLLEVGREYVIDRGSFQGQKRLEFDYVTVHVKYPGVRPLLPDVPPSLGIPNPVADGYLEEYLPYLMTSAKKPSEDYTYGQFLEKQIEEVIRMYKEEGFGTNQAYMTVGDSSSIYLNDPPCLRGIDTRVKEGKLHFIVYFRSWDLWNGFPANLGAIQLLKEYMASSIGVGDGEIIAASKGLHLYDYVWELAKLRTMCNNPSALAKGECKDA